MHPIPHRRFIVAAFLAVSSVSSFAEPPTPLASEIAKFERDKEAALKPVLAAHQQVLGQILADLVRAGRLGEALAAANAMKQMQGEAGEGAASPVADTHWTRDWPDKPTETWTVHLTKDGFAKSADGEWEQRGLVTRWKYLGNRVVLLTIEKGRDYQLCELWLINPDWSSYTGFSFEGYKQEGKMISER